MNTPAHAILNLVVLGQDAPKRTLPVFVGAVLPDAPMFVFFFWQTLVVGAPQSEIWGEAYFRAGWQDFFDVFNSIPLLIVAIFLCWRFQFEWARWMFASALMHCFFDLPLHNDDAHRHFLPLSDFRYASPVSYWDPAHYGGLAALGEVVVVCVGAAVLWRRHSSPGVRAALGVTALLSIVGYAAFYLMPH